MLLCPGYFRESCSELDGRFIRSVLPDGIWLVNILQKFVVTTDLVEFLSFLLTLFRLCPHQPIRTSDNCSQRGIFLHT